jgi:class 3 adenylate cyclase/tetratricopeptide (TPR) repeat protein
LTPFAIVVQRIRRAKGRRNHLVGEMICTNCQTANPDKAKFCFNCGTQLKHVAVSVGERKLVTVLFADVVGSTAMGERIDPEDVTEIMNGAFSFMNEAVADHQGMVARLMGDAILAFFGVPVAHENDAELGIRAGLKIRKAARQYAERTRKQYGVEFQVRIGINTGLAVMDVVGNQIRSEFTAMGDAVNLSSRLQNAAKPGEILISHDTYRHVRGLFSVHPLDPIPLKGKSEPVQVYRVDSARARAFRQPTRGVAGIETPMVGREAELELLKENLNRLKQPELSKARIVTIIGEAGVGKSRLLYEFTNWLDLQPEEIRTFRGRATEEIAQLPHSLLRDMVAAQFDIREGDSDKDAKQKLERGIAEIIPSGHADWTPIIGHVIGFNYTENPHLQGILDDAQQIRDRAFNSAVQIFKTIMQTQPVLILLEDIHWGDDGSLDFFERLALDCPDYPLMMVCLARKTLFERRPNWGAGLPDQLRLELKPLTERDSQILVAEILRNVAEISPALNDLIVSRADGNPFYVEEAIKMLIDDGVIVPGSEHWHLNQTKLLDGKIPPTLTGLLQARLDGLPEQERQVLHRASVAGRVFWDDLIFRMGNQSEVEETVSEPNAVLANLQDRELIFRQDQSAFSNTSEYIFRHAMLREVTYERLLKRLRRKFHLQVAEWLCDRSVDRREVYAGRIGEHYELAGEPAQAAEWYALAGKQAQNTYIPDMALDYYQKALLLWEQALDRSPGHRSRQIDVYHNLGQVLSWLGRYDEAIEALRKMAGAAETFGDLKRQARAWQETSEAQMHRGDPRAAIESASLAETLARKSAGADRELIKALWMRAWGAYRLGEMETAFSLAQQVSTLSRQLQDRGQMAHSLNLLGVLESASGRFLKAAQYFEQALDIFTALGNRRRVMPLMNNLGVIMEARGDYPKALIRYQEALDTAREIGNRDGEMVYLSNLGGVKVRLGDFTEAENDLRQVISMAGVKGLDVLSATYSFLAEACLGQEKVHEALESARKAYALADDMESQEDLGVAWRVLGGVAAALGEPISVQETIQSHPGAHTAKDCFVQSARIFKEIERNDERARTLRDWARYELEHGDQKQGMSMWVEAKGIFTQLGALPEVERMEARNANQMGQMDTGDMGDRNGGDLGPVRPGG